MAGTLTPTPFQTVLDDTGVASPGALIYTYTAGTTTAAATYTTSALSVANANPIVADSAGRYVAYLAAGANMKFVYKTSAGATIRTQDNVLSVPGAAVNLDIQGTVGVAVTAGQVCYLSSGAEATPLTPGLWYLTDADFAVSSTTCQSIGMAVSAIPINTAGTIRIAGLATTAAAVVVGSTYYISATAGAITTSAPALARVVGVADTTSTLILAATAAVSSTLPNPISQDLLFTDATYDIGKSGASRPRDLFQSRNATIGGTLAVTGATTLSSTLASGALTVTGNETVSGTLGVTGATTLSSTLASGALTVTGNETVSGTLGVTGATSLSSATVSSTLGVTGAATLSSTLAVTGATTLTGGLNTPLVVAQGGSGVATHTAYGVIVGGTTATGATQTITPGTSGHLLTSGGASAVPTWAAAVTTSAGIEQAFRGLQVRTSPDANVAATTVSVLGLTQWTADDGTLVDDTLTNNTAVISSSGAGGLDTGSEAASTWYEIYRIRKSSDGTLNTLLHRAKAWTADQSNLTAGSATRALRLLTSTATDKLAQGIQFANSKPFVFVDVKLNRTGAVSGNIWFTLESDTAGSPSGSVLATSDKLDASLISTTSQVIRFVFRTPYTVTATTQYHVVLQGDYTRSDTVFIKWVGDAANVYAGGVAKEYNGTSWSTVGGLGDFYFNAFTELNDTAVTMPSGYDQKCLLGYVRNNGSSNFNAFAAYGKRVMPLSAYGSLGSMTAAVPTLIDASAFIPPRPVSLWLNYNNSIAANIGYLAGVPDGFLPQTNTTRPGGQMFVYAGAGSDQKPVEYFTDYQGTYFSVAGGTGDTYLAMWEWF